MNVILAAVTLHQFADPDILYLPFGSSQRSPIVSGLASVLYGPTLRPRRRLKPSASQIRSDCEGINLPSPGFF